MLIFDQLKKNDPQLRLLVLAVVCGFVILLGGLWWVQIVCANEFRANLETQSFRSVRVPAVRGKILDRNGVVLADNRPTYNLNLYIEELRKDFQQSFDNEIRRVKKELGAAATEEKKRLNRKLTAPERKKFILTYEQRVEIGRRTRYKVVSDYLENFSRQTQQVIRVSEADFTAHYANALWMPLPVLENLNSNQIARVEEQNLNPALLDVEAQPTRFYPFNTTAAHMLGQLEREKEGSSQKDEQAFFNYRFPDYRGRVGIEAAFDATLRGKAGAKSVLVNSLSFRQTETILSPAEAGTNVVLTIDLQIQQAAERAMARLGPHSASTRGAVVVMDVQNGDVLAMVSSPVFDPNVFIRKKSPDEWNRLNDPKLRPLINRATQENYAPGSIFKPIVGLACLEAGMNPKEEIYNAPNPADPAHGHITLGKRTIKDLSLPGKYDFRRAIVKSSNTYFITNGLRYAGIKKIVAIGQKLHLGERMDLPTRQETAGIFPGLKRVESKSWRDGDTANVCIGQGEVSVTPLQIAVAYSAIANGGKVFWPRLIQRIEPQDILLNGKAVAFGNSRVRDNLGVSARNMKDLHDAMLAETEDAEGTGKAAVVPGLRICGKTGTAQVQDAHNRVVDETVWFASFAPYENPKYAVVVMVESGSSGGGTCAPIAREIYQAIQKREQRGNTVKPETFARAD